MRPHPMGSRFTGPTPDRQVTTYCSFGAPVPISWAAVGAHLLQNTKITTGGGNCRALAVIPRGSR